MDDIVPIPSPGITLSYGTVGDPVVVIVHDWFGRLPSIEPYATALSTHGLRVLVPDFYDGVCTVNSATAEQLMGQLDIGAALAQLEDAVQESRGQGSARAAVVGFSMGGWLSLLFAQAGSVDAVVAYYASLGPQDHGVIPCPVQLHLAEVDEWGDGDDPDSFVDRLKDDGTPVELYTYLGTKHSFANASIPDRVDTRAAALAFARTATFLEKHLLD